ncbi:MAG: hypothetical protein K2Q09_08005 [Phycisphaerales bacterium]|nr:hypothetical protein [Phycisphaerales bacterium]
MNDLFLPDAGHPSGNFTPPTEFTRDAFGSYPLQQRLRQLHDDYQAARGDTPRRTETRDRIAFTMLTLIKHYHEGTTDDVYELTASLATSFDFFSMAMGGLGAATGSSADKAGFSALAALGVGARSSLSRNILAEQATHAILQQMDATRIAHEARIRRALRTPDDQYPLHVALADLYDFYTAGSLKDAVADLAKGAQDAKRSAQEQLRAAVR